MEQDTTNLHEQQKTTKELKAERRRNDRIAREKDRERKRAKRLNPAYRQMEQERDRERKKVLRSNEAFRTLEKIRDRMRKERKRYCNEVRGTNKPEDSLNTSEPLLEPEVILSTTEYPQQCPHQSCHHRTIPQQYNSNAPNENPTQGHF